MKTIFTCLSFLITSFIFANNIQLQKVSLTDTNRLAKTVNIKMNISWEHSWRDSINWDAAWIIIKYKEAKENIWKWKHAQLTRGGDNAGSATGVKIVVPDDLSGAFFYRSEMGAGTISSDNVKLLWNYGAAGVANIDSVEVRVFATEMVYVPQGNYCLGDGNGSQRSSNSFQLKKAPNNYAVINDKWSPIINVAGNQVSMPGPLDIPTSDDEAVYLNGFRVSGISGLDFNGDNIAEYPNYPTGYKAFYCMKYKVTQGQYADFLNTLFANDTTATDLNNFITYSTNPYKLAKVPNQLKALWSSLADYLYGAPADTERNTISLDSLQLKFTVIRPDRAYASMDLNKCLSFSEWIGLRPMSELEYEKACRGPLPPYYSNSYNYFEKAWGNDAGVNPGTTTGSLNFSGAENGTEYFTNYDITKANMDPTGDYAHAVGVGGDEGAGPYRVGVFATETSSRISSGASYYGIMDFSKITSEIVIPMSNAQYRSFNYYTFGKAAVSAFGKNYTFLNVSSPIIPASQYKFGSVSSRDNYNPYTGFRAVRLAPSDN